MKGLFVITRRRKISAPVVIAALILIVASWFFASDPNPAVWNSDSSSGNFVSQTGETGTVSVYYFDVGQGDSGLIRLPNGENILIDAGLSSGADQLTAYLKQLGVSRIDYLIGTHPHADHIGGMAKVIQQFDIGQIYIPKVADSQVPVTRTYESMLDAAAEKGLLFTQARGGVTILQQNGVQLRLLAPLGETYDDLNDYSVVAKLTFGNRSFLFTGDAEQQSERQMVAQERSDLHSDVLKVGHHGSSSSSTASFLEAVSPQYAVISCGKNNDYGHPHKEVMNRLQKAGIQVYRTDEQGTILIRSDGDSLSVQTGLPELMAAS